MLEAGKLIISLPMILRSGSDAKTSDGGYRVVPLAYSVETTS
jgi:hypothetical protein